MTSGQEELFATSHDRPSITEASDDPFIDLGYKGPEYAATMHALNASRKARETTTEKLFDVPEYLSFDFSRYETEEIGFAIHMAENGIPYVYSYDKIAGEPDFAGALDTSPIINGAITPGQCERMVHHTNILLSRRQNAV